MSLRSRNVFLRPNNDAGFVSFLYAHGNKLVDAAKNKSIIETTSKDIIPSSFQNGYCLDFNGSTSTIDYLSTPPNWGAGPYSIYLLINPGLINTTRQIIVSKDDATLGRQFTIELNPENLSGSLGHARLTSNPSNIDLGIIPANTLTQNKWVSLLIGSSSGNTDMQFYVDGQLISHSFIYQSNVLMNQAATGLLTVGRRTYAGYNDYFQGSIAAVGFANRAPSKDIAEILLRNPRAFLSQRSRQVFFTSSASDHATSGTLSAGGATLAGAAAHKALHTTSGVLANAGAAIAGAATNFTSHATTGVLANAGATLAGESLNFTPHATSGALVNTGATLAGSALNFTPHATSGVLANTGATLAGVADHIVPGSTHSTSGTLSGSGAAIAGSSAHIAKHTTIGTLAGAGASLSGSASNYTVHSTSGNLSCSGAAIAGSSSKVTLHSTSGSISGIGAIVAGSASRYSQGTSILTQGDIDAIANAVWSHSSAVLIEQQLLEVWGRLGLDPTAPLITGQTSVTFGSIVMAMVEASGSITVTRQ